MNELDAKSYLIKGANNSEYIMYIKWGILRKREGGLIILSLNYEWNFMEEVHYDCQDLMKMENFVRGKKLSFLFAYL